MIRAMYRCPICHRPASGMIGFKDWPKDLMICNRCYEIWDAVNWKIRFE